MTDLKAVAATRDAAAREGDEAWLTYLRARERQYRAQMEIDRAFGDTQLVEGVEKALASYSRMAARAEAEMRMSWPPPV